MPIAQLEEYARECLKRTPMFSAETADSFLTLTQLQKRINANELFATPKHRQHLIDQMIAVLHGNYVFASSHELKSRFDPITTLLHLRERLVEPDVEKGGSSNWEFFRILTRIFDGIGDPHTVLELPDEISIYTGFIPLLIESYLDKDQGRERYFISHVLANCLGDQVLPGDEVLQLNGRDIEKVLRLEQSQQDAVFSPALRFDRRNLDRLTILPLAYSLSDAEHATTLRLDLSREGGKPFGFEHMFLFGELGLQTQQNIRPRTKGATQLDNLKSARSLLFAEDALRIRSRSAEGPLVRKEMEVRGNLRVESLSLDGSPPVCYVRLFSLETPDREKLVDDIVAAHEKHGDECAGLIVDIRASQGGSIRFAERLLSRLRGKAIEPVTAQMRNTWMNETFCRTRAAKDPNYEVWANSIRSRIAEGLLYSAALPFSRGKELKEAAKGNHRITPTMLIVDQNTASAAEVLAAGFVDNNVGELLGTHSSTAGACAHGIRLNKLLMERVNRVAYPYDKESSIGRIKLSICRLLRAGKHAGEVIEGNGVKPDVIVPLTRDDVLHGNRDLLATAVSRLLKAEFAPEEERSRAVESAA